MDGDSLIMVFSKLSKVADMVNASHVCRAWATAARVEQAWECAVKADFPSELHSGVFHSFETLGIMGWKARCKLLCQRVRPIRPKGGWGGQDIKAMYSFVVSVADAEGNAVSSYRRRSALHDSIGASLRVVPMSTSASRPYSIMRLC